MQPARHEVHGTPTALGQSKHSAGQHAIADNVEACKSMCQHARTRMFALHAFKLMSFKFKSSQAGGRRCAGFTSAGCLVLLLLQAQHANAVRSMLLTAFFYYLSYLMYCWRRTAVAAYSLLCHPFECIERSCSTLRLQCAAKSGTLCL